MYLLVKDYAHQCTVWICDWMASNRLKLNEEKTQVIWLGTRQQLAKITVDTVTLPHVTIQCSLTVRNLGVTLDGQLSMADHVAAISRSCFHQLRQLTAVPKSLTPEALRTLVRSFISNRLDYCNGTLVGLTDQLMQRLQAVVPARLMVPESVIPSVIYCVTYIGCQSDNASPPSSMFWPTSASTEWPHHT